MLGTGSPAGFDPDELTPPPLRDRLWPISAVALDVAGTCNLACRYCAEAASLPARHFMSPSTLDAAWRLLCADGQARAGASLRLGSGEPLLALPLLHRVGELIAEGGGSAADGRPGVFITTNGTLLDDPTANWLASSGWHVKLSLDGPQPIHDNWRVTPDGKGTFGQVAAAIARLTKAAGPRLSVTAVLCRGADPACVFEAIARLGVRRIELVPVAHRDPLFLPDSSDVSAYRTFITAYAERWLSGRKDGPPPELTRFRACVARAMGYDLRRLPCGAGRSLVGVGPDGDLYPCFRFIGLSAYCLGSLGSGLDTRAAARFRRGAGRSVERRKPCSACWARFLCGGPCFSCSDLFGPGNGHPMSLHCAYKLADAETAVRLVGQLRQHNPERLLAFLPHTMSTWWEHAQASPAG